VCWTIPVPDDTNLIVDSCIGINLSICSVTDISSSCWPEYIKPFYIPLFTASFITIGQLGSSLITESIYLFT